MQSAMLQSMDSGALAFFHRTCIGAKHGRDGEDNPIRRWWPDFITTPVTGHIGPDIIGYNKDKELVSLNKAPFDPATFKCRSHTGSTRLHSKLRAIFSSSSSSKARRYLSQGIAHVPLGREAHGNSSSSPMEPFPKGAETICPWDGSRRISKADFTADNGAEVAVQTLLAFEAALDRVLHHISSSSQ